ncbi:hypothetical protein WJX72_009764 [[Myrmecia] bisecta]|uniref:Transposase DDE domain-containing protein n=1 Tax=[Myrmecia] bisecta TaxID=41462 RepID=A0AAW1PSI7_9CHLO
MYFGRGETAASSLSRPEGPWRAEAGVVRHIHAARWSAAKVDARLAGAFGDVKNTMGLTKGDPSRAPGRNLNHMIRTLLPVVLCHRVVMLASHASWPSWNTVHPAYRSRASKWAASIRGQQACARTQAWEF